LTTLEAGAIMSDAQMIPISIGILPAYFVPGIVAHYRQTRTRGAAAVVKFVLDWTFIGWVVARAMAMDRTECDET
jgi:hypothetical protein